MKQSLFAMILALWIASAGLGQTSYWTNSITPGTPEATVDSSSVTLGLQFYSDVPGSVTAVKFYKGPHNTGTHIGTLWTAAGARLAEVTFSGETASGWQQANFSVPVSIAANTPYVISYLAPNGSYAFDPFFSWPALNAAPLHLSNSSPGVYSYGSSASFPASTWNGSNYWVDLVFVPTTASSNLVTYWPSSAVPSIPAVPNDSSSVTLGMQFYADVAGSVTAIRFYKGAENTGTHVGTLWSGTGLKLAEVTFSGETASGWQQANFSSPVNITANSPYVISYLAPQGRYAVDQAYSWSSQNAAPLHASNSSAGVYTYASGSSFPKSVWNDSNYWVDLLFVPAGSSNPSTTYSISGQVSGSAAKVTLSGATSGSVNTDASGNYSFSGLPNGSYVIAPSQSGYTFTPSTSSVSINGGSKTGVNFIATGVPVVPPPVPPPVSHSITLTWTPSISPSISGYNVYRASVSGGPYVKMNSSPIAATSYLDSNVASGQVYFYVATTVQDTNESAYSAQTIAVVPTP